MRLAYADIEDTNVARSLFQTIALWELQELDLSEIYGKEVEEALVEACDQGHLRHLRVLRLYCNYEQGQQPGRLTARLITCITSNACPHLKVLELKGYPDRDYFPPHCPSHGAGHEPQA